MKILITGSKGMLGKDLVKVFNPQNEVIASDRMDFDIIDINETLKYINSIQPQLLIHSAAYADVDGCERFPDKAYKTNAIGTRNIAVACNELNIPIVYISTDYVFDGTKDGTYKEDDFTNPINIYGKSKLAGENYIKTLSNKYFIVRTQWLYGESGDNFVKEMLELAAKKETITVVNDQFGSPTYTVDLANAIKELVSQPVYGTYHITNAGIVSWYQFAKDIFKTAGIKDIDVKPIAGIKTNKVAIRPKYSPLNNFRYRLNGYERLRDYTEALKTYMKDMVNNNE